MDTLSRRNGDDIARRRPLRRDGNRSPFVASAQIVAPSRSLRLHNYEWQRELWNFYRSGVGAFKFAMLWHSQVMSRVRLTAAVLEPGGAEPSPVTDGPGAEIAAQFFGGTVGQSQYMREMDLQLQVPGEGWVIAYDDDDTGEREWCVRSSTEIDVTTGRTGTGDLWRIEVDEGVWQTLPPKSHVFRQWIPDPERSWRPDSPGRGAINTLRIIDLLERRVVAQIVSRLASNGLLLIPQEISFPPKPGYEDSPDPFTAEWLDIATKGIANPGSAQAAIPLPVKVPREFIKDWLHMDFANTFDEKLVELLREEYDKLAVAMNMPKEVVTGMGDTSHWNAWGLDEQGIEVHIKPPVELMVAGVTKSYFHPALRASGVPLDTPDGRLVMWYDTSQLDVPPDMGAAAEAAYANDQISGDAYRRHRGFSDGDRPTTPELREQLILRLAHDPTLGPTMIEELTGTPVAIPALSLPEPETEPVPDDTEPPQRGGRMPETTPAPVGG